MFGYEKDELGRWRRGSWQQTYTGQQFYALDPRTDEIHLEDLIIGLSRENRYARQTIRPYYVAEHSVYVSIAAGQLARDMNLDASVVLDIERQGLLHDGSEAWIGDIPRPLKRQRAMKAYRKIEAKWEHCVNERFNIVPTDLSSRLVKEADNRVVLDEIRELMNDPGMWQRTNRYPVLKPLGIKIQGLNSKQAEMMFRDRFNKLWPLKAVA